MATRFPIWRLVVFAAVACVLAGGGIYWFQAHRTATASELVSDLPSANASVFFIDVDTLRRSGVLATLAGPKVSEDPDYRQFVQDTKFDYRQDLDAVAAASKDGHLYFAVSGRFHWKNLRDYAMRQGGSCHNDFCVVAGSQPDRRISFYALKPNVMAMAIAPDDFAAYQIAKRSGNPAVPIPAEPVWALIPAGALQNMDTLPSAAKAFVPALKGAEQIIVSVGADGNRQLQLGIHVTCKDAPAALALLAQFQSITKSLREMLQRQHQTPNPAELSSVLVAGNFRRDDRQVYGAWLIPKQFMDAIAGSAY